MTTSGIETKVRRIISDAQTPYRWPSEELREKVQAAVVRLNALAPHTRYVGNDVVDYIVLPEDVDVELPIAARYEEALVYYAAHLCYQKDDPDTSNAELANAYLAKAERLMV